jgi:methionine-rich copper-binding protein CopC
VQVEIRPTLELVGIGNNRKISTDTSARLYRGLARKPKYRGADPIRQSTLSSYPAYASTQQIQLKTVDHGGISMRKLIALFAAALISSMAVYAAPSVHAQLVQSTPADGAVSSTAPTDFVLEFSEAVQFHEAFIQKEGDKEKTLRDVPFKDEKNVTIPAPPLTAGHYVLMWTVFTHDDTVLRGRIRFTVSAVSDSATALPSSK